MSDSHLKSSLLRVAAELPVGDPTRREILSALADKEAGRSDIFWNIVDKRGYLQLQSLMSKSGDEQSADLLGDASMAIMEKLKLSQNEEMALNRLNNGISSLSRWDEATHRNNIFKIANLLGIRLPSAMF